MTRRALAWLLVVGLALPASGCVVDWTGQSGSYLMRSKIDVTRERTRDLERDLVAERTRIDIMDERAADARRRYADAGASVQALMEDLTYLRGQLDDIQTQLASTGQLTEDIQFQLTLVEARLYHIEGELTERVDGYEPAPLLMPEEPLPEPIEEGAGADGGADALDVEGADALDVEGAVVDGGADVAVTPELTDEEQAFREGLALIEDGAWERAGGRLQDFVQRWPNSEWYMEGRFLIGRCLYEMERYKGAITEYQKVIVRDDKSPWAPRAMYMQGMSFEQLGTPEDLDAAEVFYSELVRLYSRSEEADRARERLHALANR